jgi:putative ABC transport system permease protein
MNTLDMIGQDVRFALRSLRRARGFTAAVVITLALGSGANAAIFAIYNAALLRRLPVPAPERLVNLSSPGPKSGRTSTSSTARAEDAFSYPLFRDLERDQRGFTSLAGFREFAANASYKNQATRETGCLVSGAYFPTLGLKPTLGRLLGPADDAERASGFVVVVSHQYWRNRLAADPGVIGDTLTLNGQKMTIVGVAPPEFVGTMFEIRPQMFVPLGMAALMMPGLRNPHAGGPWNGFEDRRDHWLYVFGRLKPDQTRTTADAAINVPFAAIIRDVELPAQRGLDAAERTRFGERRLRLEPGAQGQRPEREELTGVLRMLFSVTLIVLMIACANVSNLVLARVDFRTADIMVRLSLGASRMQLVRFLLIESSLLAAMGSVGGLIVASWALDALTSLLPGDWAALHFQADAAIIVFAVVLCIAMSLTIGVYPALRGTRGDLVPRLKSASATGPSHVAAGFRNALATAQIALSLGLLIVAALFVQSLASISRIDLGLHTDRLVTFRLSPELNGYTPERSRALFERVADALDAIRGVTGVTASSVPVLAGVSGGTNVTVEGFTPPPKFSMSANSSAIGTSYFRTLGVPLLAGREFSPADTSGAPKVAIVSAAFATRFGLGANAVGRRMAEGAGGPLDIEIVGVVGDARYSQLKEPPRPHFFVPYRAEEGLGALSFCVSAAPSLLEKIVPLIPGAIAQLDPTLPVEDLRLMSEQAQATIGLERVVTALSTSFALLSLLLAAVGLYGVLSYIVARRTREIGVRMALGAGLGDVRRLIFGHVGRVAFVGSAAGCAVALILGRLAESLLFGVKTPGVGLVVAATVTVALVVFAAAAVPARRAARIDPASALRAE